MESLSKDIVGGIRMLVRRPSFALVTVLMLGLGIGANTAIFSVVNSVLLGALPFRDADRLVLTIPTTRAGQNTRLSYPDLDDYRQQSTSFEGLSAINFQSVNLTGGETPDRVRGGFVSADFFSILDTPVEMGRAFAAGEDRPGAERVVVVTHGLWQNRFGADPAFVGKTMVLNGEPFTVVGVLPETFKFPFDEVEAWIPAQNFPQLTIERDSRAFMGIGRLKPNVEVESARAELTTIAGRIADAYPDTDVGVGVTVKSLHEVRVQDVRPALLTLLGAVSFILLIACANTANLLLARGADRQREVAMRAALGARRSRLVRQLLTESAVLGVAGALVGVFLARWGVDALVALGPTLPGGENVGLNGPVLAFALALGLGTTLLFGLAPALSISKPDVNETLRGGRTTSDGPHRQRMRSVFVVSQVALSLVLLIGTGLLVRSFAGLVTVNPGFDPHGLISLEYRLPANRYSDPAAQAEFHRRVAEAASALPGVTSAAVVSGLPFSGNGRLTVVAIPGQADPLPGEEAKAMANRISPRYFETMGIPLLAGRGFTDADSADSPRVTLVNQTLARKFWGDEDPIGRQIAFPSLNATATVVGIVGDAKHGDLAETQFSQAYIPYPQDPGIFGTLVARTDGDAMSFSNAVRGAVWSVDRDQPVWKVRTVESLVEGNLASAKFLMTLMAIFGALALILTALGIYGVVSYSVSRRTQEIGIRMALGAQALDVLRMVLRGGLALAVTGVGVGLAAAFALTRLMSSLLYGISATDPWTFAAVPVLLVAVVLLACFVPARRAAKVDAMVALRHE